MTADRGAILPPWAPQADGGTGNAPAGGDGPVTSRPLRILMPYINLRSYIRRDVAILQRTGTVRLERCYSVAEMLRTAAAVRHADCLFCWFGSLRFLPAIVAARFLGRKVIVVSGGYDVANIPAIGYGNMARATPRWLGRLLFRMADAVACISDAAVREAVSNARVPSERLNRIYLGFDDLAGPDGADPSRKEDLVLTVAITDLSTIHRKGLLAVARLSRLLPDVRFVIAGWAEPQAIAILRSAAGSNVDFRRGVSEEELADLYRRAKVYLQPSLHEAFACAVAEAMLHNCVPVVSRKGSLPEVAGDAGYYAEPDDLNGLAARVRQALETGLSGVASPRERVLHRFSLAAREAELLRLVASVCGSS